MINQYADGAFERCLTAIGNDPRGTVERSGPRATASLSLSLFVFLFPSPSSRARLERQS